MKTLETCQTIAELYAYCGCNEVSIGETIHQAALIGARLMQEASKYKIMDVFAEYGGSASRMDTLCNTIAALNPTEIIKKGM